MLIRIDSERAIFAHRKHGDPPGVRVLDRHGRETHFNLEGRSANFRLAPDGTLLLRHERGIATVDPASRFAIRELIETDLADRDAIWSAAFLGVLVDTKRGRFARFELDDVALAHDLETGPVDAILLPDRRRVAILIHKATHIAIFDPIAKTTVLAPLPMSGASDAVVRENNLWFKSYDAFCRLDLETMTCSTSKVLQPGFHDAKNGLMTSAFIGVPRFSHSLSNWLLPRPYSGDILVMSGNSLWPLARISTGGKPYDIIEFDDGSLLILDYPFDVVRLAHTRDAIAF